jgi:23S rRNA pseudouridine2457 synthase
VILAFHKPYGVLSQFTSDGSTNRPLSEFGLPKYVYPIGRLDADSEGLLILSDEKALVARLLHPREWHPRRYWAQVERVPEQAALDQLASGVTIKGHHTAPCRAWVLDPQPMVLPRDPPIRFRKSVPDCWIALELTEGKNRQVRRMGAAVGHPVLRLIRKQIGRFELGKQEPGSWHELSQAERAALLERS